MYKLSINEMQKIAFGRQGRCLSNVYVNNSTKLKWQCKADHVWEARPYDIQRGRWCPFCKFTFLKKIAQSKKHSIEEMNTLAVSRGGVCLSKIYLNAHTKLKWQCNKGHIWEAAPTNIVQGKWCPYCVFGRYLPTREAVLVKLNQIAESKGGKCLSDEYLGKNSKVKFQCAQGHIWETKAYYIRVGRWCRRCAGTSLLSLKDMRDLATSKGGKCLSKVYINSDHKLIWQCSSGHIWQAVPGPIKERSVWCPECKLDLLKKLASKKRTPFREIKEFAISKGGECLSSSYKNAHTPLEWRCCEGHVWKAATAQVIKLKTWCPVCNHKITEHICRTIFEYLFKKPFPKYRPDWLKSIIKGQMELDGFCEELKLAFEYHGKQHYEEINFYNKKLGNSLKKRISYDRHKEDLCKEKGIQLIVIPYTIKVEELPKYIENSCNKLGLDVKLPATFNISHLKINIPHRLKEMNDIAIARGGICLSKQYIKAIYKLKWQCEYGHIWLATPHLIKRGTWCPKCAHLKQGQNLRLTLEELKQIAKKHEGFCLSESYIPNKKLKWQCKEGHIWFATPVQIKNDGAWCPKCSRKEATIKRTEGYLAKLRVKIFNELKDLAVSRGGRLVSDIYTTAHENHLWECSKGHKWNAKPHNVKINGTWCPICANTNRKVRF